MLNAAPLLVIFALEIVTFVRPLFRKVSEIFLLVPTVMLPKPTFVELAASEPERKRWAVAVPQQQNKPTASRDNKEILIESGGVILMLIVFANSR
jgi:hypothetical protein